MRDAGCVRRPDPSPQKPGFFDEAEVKLFDRMAADLSFAVEAMPRDEQRQALEAELRSSEERFRLATGTQSMLDALTILSPVRDDDGEITDFRYEYVDDAARGLTGLAREQLLGRWAAELFPAYATSQRFRVHRRVAQTGEPASSEDSSCESDGRAGPRELTSAEAAG